MPVAGASATPPQYRLQLLDTLNGRLMCSELDTASAPPLAGLQVPVILGPTGIGKSRVAFELALALGGEIVVCDSRQVYAELDIATNKPLPAALAEVHHHLVGIANPRTVFNAHDFVVAAGRALVEIAGRGRRPIIEGGSVLWTDALCDGLSLAGVPPQPDRRAALELLSTEDLGLLVEELDPDAQLDRRNRVRLIRAIEVLEAAGPPLTRFQSRTAPAWEPIRIGIRASMEVIERRLADRSQEQVDRGLVEETRRALESGIKATDPVLTGIGYREAVARLANELSEAELPRAMLRSNRRYARYQLKWLARDPRIRWFEAEPDPVPAILKYLKETLN